MTRRWAAALLLLLAVQSAAAESTSGALQRDTRKPVAGKPQDIVGTVAADKLNFKVTGGHYAIAPQYDHIVGISYRAKGQNAICTGTLLTKDLVLTAGHCGCGDSGSYRVTQQSPMGSGDLIAVTDDPILFDPRICERATIIPGYDLALLRLGDGAKFNPKYQAAIPLAKYTRPFIPFGALITVVGFGLNEKQSWGTRLEGKVPIYSTSCLQTSLIYAGCAPFLEMILADAWSPANKRVDTCGGDSGGPALAQIQVKPQGSIGDPEKPDGGVVTFLVGVTSRAAPLTQSNSNTHCGGGGIYTVLGRNDVRGWLIMHGVTYLQPTFTLGNRPANSLLGTGSADPVRDLYQALGLSTENP